MGVTRKLFLLREYISILEETLWDYQSAQFEDIEPFSHLEITDWRFNLLHKWVELCVHGVSGQILDTDL